jgi:hypothetical protein
VADRYNEKGHRLASPPQENQIMKPSALLAAVALLAVAGQVSAASMDTTVTPANVKEQTYPALAVTVKDSNGLKRFEVVVKGKAGEEARFLQDATLTLEKGGRTIATCPVARTERKGDVVFSFGVSADHLDGSSFKVAYISHVKVKDKRGRERWMGMPSGKFLTFPLEAFAKAGKGKQK